MFQFVTKVFKTVWGEDGEEGDGSPKKDKASSGTSVDDSPTSSVDDVTENKRTFAGYITNLHNDYGLVDHQVYFSYTLCKGAQVPKLGTKVTVTAERKHSGSGWSAVSLVPLDEDTKEDWDDDSTGQGGACAASQKSSHSSDSLVAMVTGVDGHIAYLNGNLLLDLSGASSSDFTPCKGDWVTASTQLDPLSGECRVIKISPLRNRDFEGEINSLQRGFGYIDSDIYFSFGVCSEGYTPRRQDRVRGRAIECSRGRCPWRAIQVIPVRESPCSPKSPQAPTLNSPTELLLADKENVQITDSLDFGEMHRGEEKSIKAFIRNESAQSQTLMKCRFLSNDRGQFRVEKVDFVPPNKAIDPGIAVLVPPGNVAVVHLQFTASDLGANKKLLVFEFKTFKIGRYVHVNVKDSSYKTLLQPSTPYQRRMVADRFRQTQASSGEGWLVPGQRPNRNKLAIKLPNRLPQFPIPKNLESAYLDDENVERAAPSLAEELSMNNYTARFSALLHMEEIQENIDIRQFDLERVTLRHHREYLALVVPGLAEGRPSVLVSDSVILTPPGLYDSAPEYQGYVHEILSTEVLLKFHADFHNQYNGEDYNVRFLFNRMPLRRCHQAVNFAPSLGSEVLFPDKLIPKVPQTKIGQHAGTLGMVGDVVKVSPVVGMRQGPRRRPRSQAQNHEFFNSRLNSRQRAAVLRILSGQGRPSPYVLFGPPGTGKTVTLVEALLQVLNHIPASRIIACTPSNSAADLLTERLHLSGRIKPSDIARLNSYSRNEESIPSVIKPYCHTGDDLELVSRHRVVICTCTSAGMMYSLGLRPGHFTHVFVDEAGQATEPECLCPVGLVAGADGQIVLAGDPRQLGPVLQSQLTKDYGLGLSFLERLIQSPLYERNSNKFADHGSYDPLLVTKLVENYRSHEVLLKLPSLLFYHNELLASADHALTDSLTAWEKLPNKDNFPLLFHGIRGEDMREGNSPSWFNPMEALQVMRYLKSLNPGSSTGLTFDDIGIITPYRKQVEKIRLLIDDLGMDRVKVGSVEEFQGQERLVMIISTVRSTEAQVRSDIRHNLGFLSNPKRFNVAISRAQALMIVIGNPHVLAQDENWKILIKYCVRNGAYAGSDLPNLNLAQDIDLEPAPRTSTPTDTHKSPDTTQDLPPVSASADPNVQESQEAETLGAGSVDVLTSESDGDETLSVHSADTEINVFLTSLPKVPSREVITPQAKDEQLEKSKIAEGAIPQEEQNGACENNTIKVCDTNQSVLTSEPQSMKETQVKVCKEPIEVTRPMEQLSDTQSSSSCSDPIEKYSVSSSEKVSCSSPTDTTLRQPPPTGLRPTSTSPDNAKRTRARKNTAERLLFSVQKTQSQKERPGGHSPLLPKSGGWIKEDRGVSQQNSLCTDDEDTRSSLSNSFDTSCSDVGLHTGSASSDSKDHMTNNVPNTEESQMCLENVPYLTFKNSGIKDKTTFTDLTAIEHNLPLASVPKETLNSAGFMDMTLDNTPTDLRNGIHLDNVPDNMANTTQDSLGNVAPIDLRNHISPESVPEKTSHKVPQDFLNAGKSSTYIDSPSITQSDRFTTGRANPNHISVHQDEQKVANVATEIQNECTDRGKRAEALGRSDMNGNTDDFPVTKELERKIIRQIEHYFGTFNMSKDRFMQDLVAQDSGWVKLEMLVTFNRLRALTTDFGVITSALRKSKSGLLEVDERLHRVRRNHPLPDDYGEWKLGLKDRSLFVIGLKTETEQEELAEALGQWGAIEHIHPLPPQRRFKDEVAVYTYPFVLIYKNPSDARTVLKNHRLPFKESMLYVHIRDDIDDMLFRPKNRQRRLNARDTQLPAKRIKAHPPTTRVDSTPPTSGGLQSPSTPQGAFKGRGRAALMAILMDAVSPADPGPGAAPSPSSPNTSRDLPRPPRHRGRSRANPANQPEPTVGATRQDTRQHPAVPPSYPAVRTPTQPCVGQGRSASHAPPMRVDSSPPPGTDSWDDSLDQEDSDVIIESSEEEYF